MSTKSSVKTQEGLAHAIKREMESTASRLLPSSNGDGHAQSEEITNSPPKSSIEITSLTPINDITDSDATIYTKGEKLARCKLAALYRLVDLNGWSQQIYNHISYRVDREKEHFLINPYGLLYSEISASSLVKVTTEGDVVDQGSTNFPISKSGFTIHSAIHAGRPDLNCVIHVHIPEVIAVSMMEGGILPISLEACAFGQVSVHPCYGVSVDLKERELLVKHLGPKNKVMLLQNHGLLACGETIEEAYCLLFSAIDACKTQVRALSCIKRENLILLDKEIQHQIEESYKPEAEMIQNEENPIQWGYGDLLFEAQMRRLDSMGYRTGYRYKNPVSSTKRPLLENGTAEKRKIDENKVCPCPSKVSKMS